MPRENPRKRNRRLRAAAEAQHRAALQVRREAAAAERVVLDALERARRRKNARAAAAGEGCLDTTVKCVEQLLQIAAVAAPVRERVVALYGAFRLHLPDLYRVACLPFAWLVASQPWVRPLAEWRPPGGSESRRRDALVAHLLARFPTPRFLFRAFDVPEMAVARAPEEDEWAVRVFATVGRGESPLGLVKSGVLPPLTRRMLHLFLRTKASVDPIAALRHAQVAALGGTPALARALLAGRLGTLRGRDERVGEPFWAEVIAWLCRQTELALDRVPAMLDYVESRRREALASGEAWSLVGRTAASLERQLWVWELSREGGDLPASGLLPLDGEGWQIAEIGSAAALAALGARMHNCVAQYAPLTRLRKVAIFALAGEGLRGVTIEVALGTGRVVQAKAPFNRPCTADERARILAWARLNRLEVARRL